MARVPLVGIGFVQTFSTASDKPLIRAIIPVSPAYSGPLPLSQCTTGSYSYLFYHAWLASQTNGSLAADDYNHGRLGAQAISKFSINIDQQGIDDSSDDNSEGGRASYTMNPKESFI